MKSLANPLPQTEQITWKTIQQLAGLDLSQISNIRDTMPYEVDFASFSSVINTLAGNQVFWLPLLLCSTSSRSTAFIIDDSFGNISHALSKHFSKIVSAHSDKQSLITIERFLKANNVTNVQLIQVDPSKSLPFESATFSAVILCRTLNFIAQYYGNEQKYTILNNITEEAMRLTADDGSMLLIDNNTEDFRSVVKKIKTLQFNKLHIKCSLRKNQGELIQKGFTVKTYIGKEQYKQNFTSVPVFFDYNNTHEGELLTVNLKQAIKRRVRNLPIIKSLWPSYILIATKNGQFDNLIQEILLQAGIDGPDKFSPGKYIAKRIIAGNANNTVMIVGMDGTDDSDLVLRIPSTEEGKIKVERNADNLIALKDTAFHDVAPKLLAKGICNGYSYYIEEKMSGRELEAGVTGKKNEQLIRNACVALTSRQLATVESYDNWHDFLHQSLDNIEKRLTCFCNGDEAYQLSKITALLKQLSRPYNLQLVKPHGDFKPGNILYRNDGSVSAIIDWDMSQDKGLPLIDIYTYFIYQVSEENDNHLCDTFINHVLPWDLIGAYNTILDDEKSKLAVDDHLLLPLRCITWLMIMVNHIGPTRLTHYQTARMIIGSSLTAICSALDARQQTTEYQQLKKTRP